MLFRESPAVPTAEDSQVIEAMRRERATSPARACPSRDLPPMPTARFEALVHAGIIREAAPGSFYLYEPALSGAFADEKREVPGTRSRALKVIVFWLLVILIPVLFIQLSR